MYFTFSSYGVIMKKKRKKRWEKHWSITRWFCARRDWMQETWVEGTAVKMTFPPSLPWATTTLSTSRIQCFTCLILLLSSQQPFEALFPFYGCLENLGSLSKNPLVVSGTWGKFSTSPKLGTCRSVIIATMSRAGRPEHIGGRGGEAAGIWWAYKQKVIWMRD